MDSLPTYDRMNISPDISHIISKHMDENFGEENFLLEETTKTIEILKEINRLGFLTDDSQDGVVQYGKIPKNVVNYIKISSDLWSQELKDYSDIADEYEKREARMESREKRHKPESKYPFPSKPQEDLYDLIPEGLGEGLYTTRDNIEKHYKDGHIEGLKLSQRAYLAGYMPQNIAYVFHYLFNLETDKICTTSEDCSIPLTYQIGYGPTFDPDDLYVSHLSDKVPITTRTFPCDTCNDTWKEGYNAKLVNYDFVSVDCLDPKHGRNTVSQDGLFTEVLRILKKAIAIIQKSTTEFN